MRSPVLWPEKIKYDRKETEISEAPARPACVHGDRGFDFALSPKANDGRPFQDDAQGIHARGYDPETDRRKAGPLAYSMASRSGRSDELASSR